MEAGWAQILLTLGSMLFISGSTAGVLHFQAKELTRRLQGMEDEMKQMTSILVNQATQAVRLDTMDKRLGDQGKRLDDAMKAHTDGLLSMARMVESVTSRMNNLIDEKAKEMLRGS